MRRGRVLVIVPTAAAVWAAGALAGCGVAVQAAGSWGRAIQVPGLRALNKGGDAGVSSVSCVSAGNCTAGGNYKDAERHYQGFVAVERSSRWGKAIEVPGLGTLNKGDASVGPVSCASAGNCAAGGDYTDTAHRDQGFVVSERNGRWGRAIKVPGVDANNDDAAGVTSVSCGSPGNCAAGGNGMVVINEKHGRWGRPVEVPGLAALSAGGNALIYEMSCPSAGNCAAGGYYTDRHGDQQGYVVAETHGRWGRAMEVPGLAALNTGGYAAVEAVSCASAGNCAAGGHYGGHGFVVSEKNGTWGRAIQVPGLTALGGGGDVSSISCASPGNCAAGGGYGWPYGWAFVVSETNGVWGRAINVPGLEKLVTGRYADLSEVSCASPGNCAAGGDYEDMPDGPAGFVVSEKNGRWGRATNAPVPRAAWVSSVSCAPAGDCTAGGSSARNQGFVT